MFNVTWRRCKNGLSENTLVMSCDINTDIQYKLHSGEYTLEDMRFKNSFRESLSKRYRGTKVKDMIIEKVERI